MGKMRFTMTVGSLSLMALLVVFLTWLARAEIRAVDPQEGDTTGAYTEADPLYLGVIPERDIFEQRRRYRALADYMSDKLHRRVTLVTSSTYLGALNDMAAGRTDIAFMGSLVAAMTMEQVQARVLVKPQAEDGISTYRGVLFVLEDSPIRQVKDLTGHSLGMVRTTTAGHLFPIHVLSEHNLLAGTGAVTMRWLGTHDQVAFEVEHGRVDVGAAKDLRINAYEQQHPDVHFHRLMVSEPVPNNALLVRRELDDGLVESLRNLLLNMDKDEAGQEALRLFGAACFQPCVPEEYKVVYDMAEALGPGWETIGRVLTEPATELALPGEEVVPIDLTVSVTETESP